MRADRFTDICKVQAKLAPCHHPAQRLGDDVEREGSNQRGLLDEGDEPQRRQQAALGVLPAPQRLDAADSPRLQVDLGLMVQDELLALQGQADLAEQQQPRGIEAVALRREDLDPAAV